MISKILEAKKKLQAAEASLKKIIRTAQKRCEHKNLAECDYHNNGWSIYEPVRICLDCGLTEEGWGCGYIVLKALPERVGKIDRNKLYSLREGFMIRDKEKGPLLRQEVTLAQLIDGMEVKYE